MEWRRLAEDGVDMKVTAVQAATLLGISERTVRRRIAVGRLPACKVASNRYEVELEDVLEHKKDVLEHKKDQLAELHARMDRLEAHLTRIECLLETLANASTLKDTEAHALSEGDYDAPVYAQRAEGAPGHGSGRGDGSAPEQSCIGH